MTVHCVVTVEAEAEHINAHCESDISGVATDDTDLSSLSLDADIAMETGNIIYSHQPNPVFNTLLTCCTVLIVCFVLGIGIGHYFGQSVPGITYVLHLGLAAEITLYFYIIYVVLEV